MAPIDFAIFAIFLMGLIVPSTFDMCVIETIFVLFVKYFLLFVKSISPDLVKGRYLSLAPILFANCCQGTILA